MASFFEQIAKVAPTVAGIAGAGAGFAATGTPMGAMVGFSIGSAGGSLLASGAALNKKSGAQGATGAQRGSEARVRSLAQDLQSGEGLSETQFSRGMEGIFQSANQITANVLELARESRLSPIAVDKMIEDRVFEAQAKTRAGLADIRSEDIIAAVQKRREGLQAEALAGQRADVIQATDERKATLDKLARDEALTKVINSASKLGMSTMGMIALMKSTPDTTDTTETTTETATATTTGTTDPTTQTPIQDQQPALTGFGEADVSSVPAEVPLMTQANTMPTASNVREQVEKMTGSRSAGYLVFKELSSLYPGAVEEFLNSPADAQRAFVDTIQARSGTLDFIDDDYFFGGV